MVLTKLFSHSCCQTDGRGPVIDLPTFCFEKNGCKGLQWLGAEACSDEVLNSVTQILEETLIGKLFSEAFFTADIINFLDRMA